MSAHVLVFDSGVGALSIIEEIRQRLPALAITYASDNAFFPYGTKSEDELVERVDAVLHALMACWRPDLIVVACNTASTLALPRIRSHFDLPVVGVVPAIKPAAAVSKSRVIGLLATPGTVRRPYTRQLIEDFAADCEIIAVGSGRLVELAEQKLRGHTPAEADLSQAIAPLLASPAFERMDTLVLGCTHFPLLKEELSRIIQRPLNWVDSGEAIARRVAQLLEGSDTTWIGSGQRAQYRSVFTGNNPALAQLGPQLRHYVPGQIYHLDIASGTARPFDAGGQ